MERRRSQYFLPVVGRIDPPLPLGSVDCHMHIFDQGVRSLHPERSYDPIPALLHDYQMVAEALGIARTVIVQPSVYGTDNVILLEILAATAGRFRGIVVVDESVTEQELMRMDDLGVRGVRLNLVQAGGISSASLLEVGSRIAERNWHIQVVGTLDAISKAFPLLDRLETEVVVDHFAFAHLRDFEPGEAGTDLLARLESGKWWMKLSADYRLNISQSELSEIVSCLVGVSPDRLLWGTDWPHPDYLGQMPDEVSSVSRLRQLLKSNAQCKAVFRDNALSLFGWKDTETDLT